MADEAQIPEGSEEQADASNPNLSAEEQAAVDKARSGLSEVNPNAVPDNRPQRPEGIPEKFWDAEKGEVNVSALVQSYTELEKMRGQKPEEKAEEPSVDKPAADENGKIKVEDEAEETAENPLATAMETAREQFAANGEVSDEAIAALEEAGIPREIFDVYMAGIQAQSKQLMASVYETAGGEEAYTAMTKWASANLSKEQIEAYNSALDNPDMRETAILGLKAKFTSARPSEGNLVTPHDTPSASADIFTSLQELTAAQRDPRYGTDPAYQKSVIEKLARSQKAGFAAFDRQKFERQIIQ